MISSNSHAIKRPFSAASSNTSFVTPYASLDLPKPSGPGVRPSSVHAQSVAGKLTFNLASQRPKKRNDFPQERSFPRTTFATDNQ